jgi:hypothetical protein
MGSTSQARALKNYRERLNQQGMARFEVLGLATDRELIRALARQLAENSPKASVLPGKGGILAALRRSPLVGAELDLARPRIAGRKVDL